MKSSPARKERGRATGVVSAMRAAGTHTSQPASDLRQGEAGPRGSKWTSTHLMMSKSYRRLLESVLSSQVEQIFTTLAGLSLSIVWDGSSTSVSEAVGNRFCPRSLRRLRSERRQPLRCSTCRRRNWERRGGANSRGFRFRGLCGTPTLWVALHVADAEVGRAVLQAPAHASAAVEATAGLRQRA